MFRAVSLYFRRRAERKNIRSVLDSRVLREQELKALPAAQVQERTLAVLRMDDIGDYLLYRNFLPDYRLGKWAGYTVTLIGNQVWKPIFERFDSEAADHTIWVDKHRFFGEEDYRKALWQQLRAAGFEVVICPSRTRPLLIDDLMALATGAPLSYAMANTYTAPEWNMVSDAGYSRLFPPASHLHEFSCNRHFSNWVNEHNNELKAPCLPLPAANNGQVICFIGASAKSKRWPLNYWISLVQQLQAQGLQPVIAGGKQEQEMAGAIQAATAAVSFAGTTSLTETLDMIGAAKAVISGDTMAAHAAVAYHKPLVILANGVNATRFVDYKSLDVQRVTTLYTAAYERYLRAGHNSPFMAVTSDMQSIKPEQVTKALLQLL